MNKACMSPSNPSSGIRAAQHHTSKMMLVFGQGEVQLSMTEIEALKNWVVTWSAMRKRNTVAMSGASEASRTGRLRRVYSLVQALIHLGVRAKSIRQEEDLAKPTRMGLMDDLPADVVWLEFVEPRGDIRPSGQQAPTS
ncbi:MAG: hypothetical protein PHQ58_19405 [Rhodoferax sp.]|uniref:hypothetical protein n=1 Tax=Rhodoferax sp. TaxID=50421 RepID=UPI002610878C|nr:hypothetical protein [Rhodoferax sp.]MDD2882594.1 hypothetical protein [Rhodoferax sp.]